MKLTGVLSSVMALGLLSACVSNGETGRRVLALSNVPSWVLNPTSDNGLADSACVLYSGNLNVDRSEAIVLASQQLAAQLERKVAFLAKSFQTKTLATEGLNVGSDFNQTGQQLVQQSLLGAKATKIKVVEIAGKEQLCLLLEMTPNSSQVLYQQLKGVSQVALSSQDDSVIYEQFRLFKANQELQKASKK